MEQEDGLTVYMTEEAVRSHLAERFSEHGSQSKWTRKNRVSRATISNVTTGGGGISQALAEKFGFTKVVRYIAIGGQP